MATATDLQQWLASHGYDVGPVDGQIGARTIAAAMQALAKTAVPADAGDDAALNLLMPRLKAEEGFRAKPYRDTLGYLTIGYGTNIDAGIGEAEAAYLLRSRAVGTRADLRKQWPAIDRLDAARQSAVLDMAYNLGVPKLLMFHDVLAALAAGQWNAAASAALDSRWASQVGDRAKRIAAILRNGAA